MPTRLMKHVPAIALALALATPAVAQDEAVTADTVVATVNGEEITLAHMLMIRASLPDQYQQLPNDVLWDGILDQIIQQQVLSQDDGAEETRRVRVALENERRSLLAAEVVSVVAADALTDEAVQAMYEEQYVNGDQGMEFNASHILVETVEEAQTIIEELNGGADFAEVARAKSTGPSGANGGALGWFSAGMMVQAFQDAVEGLEDGAISEPVETQFGWHVIKRNESRAKAAPALDEVRTEIEGTLQQEAVQVFIGEAVEAAEVTRTAKEDIDTSVLSNIELLEQ